jgi:acylphosphatase
VHIVHLVIHGHVQGVGFRYFAVREAQRLELTGVVRNRADGAVEVEAEGDRPSLERLVETLRAGPRAGRVASVDEHWSEGSARHRGFEIGHEAP